MRRLFQSFERERVEFLLISGQASILYGAAMFSEDVDIWLRPTSTNVQRFLRALSSRGARVHKLTPPMSVRNLKAGHGFHFVVPGRPQPIYLDVMGQPPRVGAFGAARKRSEVMETDWGHVPVVAIPDLVALKRTRRLGDYEVISNLAHILVAAQKTPDEALLNWAERNAFRAEDRAGLRRAQGKRASVEECREQIARELVKLQRADVAYWKRHLGELRKWRRDGSLWPEGALVADFLARPGRKL